MRFHLLALVLLASTAAPAVAQQSDQTRRIDRLEQELRALQRRTPGAQTVQPEIRPVDTDRVAAGVTGDAILNLTGRVDALEAQLRSLTGQVEEAENRSRQAERQVERLRAEHERRLAQLEARPAAPAPVAEPERPAPRPSRPTADTPAPADSAATAAATDPAEAAYNAGFRLWEQRRYADAQRALEAAVTAHPRSRWASWSRNLQGRAYLDDNKPATAARVFLANYQDNPRGERAADSLYFLGEALTRLNRRGEACRVYDELVDVYPEMRSFLRQRLPAAREAARCGAAAASTERTTR